MKKICYVVTIPLTIRTFFIPQLKYLAENGYDVTVICNNDGKIEKELGDSIHFFACNSPRGVSFFKTIVSIIKLFSFFRKQSFDMVQFSTPNAAFCASVAARLSRVSVRNYHLMGFRYLGLTGINETILKWIEKITCRNSTTIECVSMSNMQFGIQEGLFPPEKVTVVWNGSSGGVDLDKFDYHKRNLWRNEIRNELYYNDSDFIYGFVGRITRDKGINELLEAFLSLNTDAKLLIIGEKERANTLNENLIREAEKNPNIQFHNEVCDIERYYAAIDTLVLPSYREGFGNVIIEAGAVGTPSIVTDIPGPTDAVERDLSALVVEPKNVKALGEAMQIIRMMDYNRMGLNAVRFAKEKFESKELCKMILKRKQLLLSDTD